MNRERYLSESTEEAVQMRDKVKNLLYSKDNTNIELAYQIIKGGGMHPDFVPVLWAMNLSKGHRKRERNKIEKLVKEILSENAMLIFHKTTTQFLDTYLYQHESWEDWADVCLTAVGESEELAGMQAEIALSLMIFLQIGGRFAMKNALLPTNIILKTLINTDRNNLSLFNFHLHTLPAEMANLPALTTLDLQGNALQHIPESLENLPLDEIVLPADLPTQVLSGLARAYPKAMGAWYKTKGYQVSHQSQHTQRNGTRVAAKAIAKKAITLLEKVPEAIYDDSYWFSLGLACVNAGLYERSIEANLKLVTLNPKYGSGVGFYNIACAYSNMGNKEQMLTYLQLASQQSNYMNWFAEAREDNDFEKYWQDADLLAL